MCTFPIPAPLLFMLIAMALVLTLVITFRYPDQMLKIKNWILDPKNTGLEIAVIICAYAIGGLINVLVFC